MIGVLAGVKKPNPSNHDKPELHHHLHSHHEDSSLATFR